MTRLGKKLGVVHDRRTIMARQLLAPEQIRVPVRHRVGGKMTWVPTFDNDRYGDCVFASEGHCIVTHERSASQHEIQVTTDQILQEYADVTGFRRDDPGTDNGAYELDGLNNWRRNGIGLEKDGTPHRIYAFAAVDWRDRAELEMAHYVFGGLKVCAGLPMAASDQLQRGEDWRYDNADGRGGWGSWGGHSMYSHAYDANRGLAVWTWGREQWMSWDWVDCYVDECYCVVNEDYFRRSGTTPQGFDRARLDELLEAL